MALAGLEPVQRREWWRKIHLFVFPNQYLSDIPEPPLTRSNTGLAAAPLE
jgi:hypothetical protein